MQKVSLIHKMQNCKGIERSVWLPKMLIFIKKEVDLLGGGGIVILP